MRFTQTKLHGAYILDLETRPDDRGFFARAFCQKEFAQHGLKPLVAQCNTAYNHRKGTLRGLHYQLPPAAETKLVRCTRGAIFDVVVDVRPGSPTERRWVGVNLAPRAPCVLYVGEGLAHGYLTLEDDTEVSYLISTPYVAEAACGARFDDPAFAIAWPAQPEVISRRDRSFPHYHPGSA
jgi:dTDP-4-dehydrorhamnose 3,5-epimerase